MAVLEVFGILAYLQWTGKLEGKWLTNVFAPFAFYGAMGVGLGLACGLLWVLLSRTSWHHRLEPVQARAWERGLLVALFVFIFLGVVVHDRVYSNIPLHHPLSLLLSVGLLLLSAGLAFSFEWAARVLDHRRRLKGAVTLTMALLLTLAFGSVLYWQDRLSFWNFVNKTVAAAKLKGDNSSNRPNILLITVDTLRADHLSAYGYKKIRTKNIDRLAKEGVLFEQMIAQSPWTRSSFGSIWTSLYPSQHQANGRYLAPKSFVFNRGLIDRVPTMAEFFSDAGYVTIGVNTNPHITKIYGFDRGFQLYIDDPYPLNVFRYSIFQNILEKFSPHTISLFELHDLWYLPARGVYKIYYKIITKLQAERKPFFLWVHFMDPHLPYYAHEKVVANGRSYTSVTTDDDRFYLPGSTTVEQLFKNLGDVSLMKDIFVKIYDSELLYVDRYIGEILRQLRRSNFLTNTLVVLTSDHGEEFFDHGKSVVVNNPSDWFHVGYGHGHTMYDELIRIPLIIKFPNNQYANQRVTSIVQHIDLLPTLLAFAGIPVDPSRRMFEGINILRYLSGDRAFPTRYAKSEFNFFGPEVKQIRSDRYKLILKTYDQTTEFYDLALDPMEQNNVANSPDEPYRQTFSALNSWMARMRKESPSEINEEALLAGTKESPAKNIDQKRREELKERLKSLGYVQ